MTTGFSQSVHHARRARAGLACVFAACVCLSSPAWAQETPSTQSTSHAQPAEQASSASSAVPEEDGQWEPLEWGNDFACVPNPAHPRPVLLLPGTWAGAKDFSSLGQRLKAQGYCVYSLTYGRDHRSLSGAVIDLDRDHPKGGVGEMHRSAEQVRAAIEDVLHDTAAGRAAGAVDLVGHSQAGALIKYVLAHRGGSGIHQVITLGGTNHGTTLVLVNALHPNGHPVLQRAGEALLGQAPLQQVVDAPMVAELNALPDTVPGVRYTVVTSKNDLVSTPHERGFLQAVPGAEVDNLVIQQRCGVNAHVSHDDLRDGALAGSLVAHALADEPARCDVG